MKCFYKLTQLSWLYALLLTLPGCDSEKQRTALVIGNSQYEGYYDLQILNQDERLPVSGENQIWVQRVLDQKKSENRFIIRFFGDKGQVTNYQKVLSEDLANRLQALQSDQTGVQSNSLNKSSALIQALTAELGHKHPYTLKNPVNDARAMSKNLKKMGFEVSVFYDLDQSQMKAEIEKFGSRLPDNSVALFYYAGHAIQQNGKNYFVDQNGDQVNLSLVFSTLQKAKDLISIIILDACRNDPDIGPEGVSTRGLARSKKVHPELSGLALLEGPTGSITAYSTSSGSKAFDGVGDHGLFTKHLLKEMMEPNLHIAELFSRVRQAVLDESMGKQIPWERSSLTQNFRFNTFRATPQVRFQ